MQTNEIRLAECLIGEINPSAPVFDSIKKLLRVVFAEFYSGSFCNPRTLVDLNRSELYPLGLDIVGDCRDTLDKTKSRIHVFTTRLTISLCKHNPKQLYVSVHGVDHDRGGHYFWFYIDREQK